MKTPLQVMQGQSGMLDIADADEFPVCVMVGEGKEVAEAAHLIVRACNSHEDLKQRLCRALDERDSLVRMLEKATHALSLYNDKLPMLAELNAAIAKVRGDQ